MTVSGPDEAVVPRSFFSLPDGDVVLQSSDEISFRVDSIVLRRASQFFDSLFKLPQSKGQPSEPLISMDESGSILDDILRSIYPPIILPTISSVDHALALFHALQKLDISNTSLLDAVTQYIGNIKPSIRAWAIAVDIGNVKARKMAVKRFMHDDYNIFTHYHFDELNRVDASSLLKLGWLREHVISEASAMDFPIGWCTSHSTTDRSIGSRQLCNLAAADSLVPTEKVLQILVGGAHCLACSISFQDVRRIDGRHEARVFVEELLEHATNIENGTVPMSCKYPAERARILS